MTRTLFARLMLAFVVVIGLTAALRTVLVEAVYPSLYAGQVRSEVVRNAQDIAAWARAVIAGTMSQAEADQQLHVLARLAGARVWVVNAAGTVLVDVGDDAGPSWAGVQLHPAYLGEVRQGLAVDDRRSPWLESSLSVGYPVLDGDRFLGAVFLYLPHQAVRQDNPGLRTLFLSTGVITVTVGVFMAYFVSRNIANPVRMLNRFAQALARGRLGERVAVEGPVELRRLGATLSTMSAQLRDAFAALEAEKSRMSAIIAAMAEGVVAVGSGGRVLLANPAAARLLDCRPEGLPLEASGLPGPLVQSLREALRRPAANQPTRIVHSGTELLALVSSVLSDGGAPVSAVAVIQDVTVSTGLQRARENFVANVSHELRSPLHGMLLLVDALADGTIPPELQSTYLDRLRGEVNRLQRLTNDLLELSRIDAGIVTIGVDPVDLNYVASTVVGRLQLSAQAVGVTLAMEVPEETLSMGNADRLEQVLTNLIENAIRFTPDGGQITISAQRYPDVVRLQVADTGMGIPAERLPHIFERFYKADPARTRSQTGGTGLGLAIVKHLVELMGGEVSVQSQMGAGTTFTVMLPTPPAALWPARTGNGGESGEEGRAN